MATRHYHLWLLYREHSIVAFGTDPVLRRLPDIYENRTTAYRALGGREGKILECHEIHVLGQLFAVSEATQRHRGDPGNKSC